MTASSKAIRHLAALAVLLSATSCATFVSFDDHETRAATRPTRVRVMTSAGAAKPGAFVVFQSAGGAVLDTQRTSADGLASSNVRAALVTVAWQHSETSCLSRRLMTFAGVEPGDELRAYEDALAVDPPVGRMSVRLPPVPDASEYEIRRAHPAASVRSDDPELVFDVFPSDLDADGATSVVAHARRSTSPVDLYLADRHVRLTRESTTQVALAGPWLEAETIPVAVKHSPQHTGPDPRDVDSVAVGAIVGEHEAFWSDASSTDAKVPRGLADELIVYGFARSSDLGEPNDKRSRRWSISERGPVERALAVDLSSLPEVFAGLDVTDAKRPLVRWSASLDGAGSLVWLLYTPPQGGCPHVFWSLLVPADRREQRLPELPIELDSWLPDWAAFRTTTFAVEVIDGDAIPTLAALRENNPSSLPPRGRVRRSGYYELF